MHRVQSRKPPNGQNVFFSFFRQAISKLHDSFTMVFTQNGSILHWAVHQPITLSQFWSVESHKVVQTGHWRTMASLAMLFSKIVCIRTNPQQWNNYSSLLNYKICVHEDRESLASIVDSVFEESLVNDSSANIAYIYWKSLWRQTCCSVIDANFSSSIHCHAHAF